MVCNTLAAIAAVRYRIEPSNLRLNGPDPSR
jgi:hypothetical protein